MAPPRTDAKFPAAPYFPKTPPFVPTLATPVGGQGHSSKPAPSPDVFHDGPAASGQALAGVPAAPGSGSPTVNIDLNNPAVVVWGGPIQTRTPVQPSTAPRTGSLADVVAEMKSAVNASRFTGVSADFEKKPLKEQVEWFRKAAIQQVQELKAPNAAELYEVAHSPALSQALVTRELGESATMQFASSDVVSQALNRRQAVWAELGHAGNEVPGIVEGEDARTFIHEQLCIPDARIPAADDGVALAQLYRLAVVFERSRTALSLTDPAKNVGELRQYANDNAGTQRAADINAFLDGRLQ